jgi:hypothetical protein
MTEEKTYSESEAHRAFAIQYHGQTWDLMDKEDRSPEDDALMIHTAHASCRHWLEVGTGLHHQRGEWLISRVYAVLGLGDPALRHAELCGELTESHADLMTDFDKAFAFECLARANALAGKREKALEYMGLAEKAGEAIAGDGDREYFFSDLNGGEWNGLR